MSLLSPGDLALLNDTVTLLSNASLIAVETPGPLADNGDPGTPVEAWTGTAPGFLERKDRNVLSAGVEVQVKADTFILFDQAGVEAGITLSDVLAGADWTASTIVIADGRVTPAQPTRFSVVGMEHEADGTMDHILLTLDGGVAA